MAKVYTGKVMIPGDKLDKYFQILKETEEKGEPFRKYLIGLNQEFEEYLSIKLSERTVRKHTSIVDLFIDFICRQTDAECIEEITKGMGEYSFQEMV